VRPHCGAGAAREDQRCQKQALIRDLGKRKWIFAGRGGGEKPFVAAAKFVMSKLEPEQEANRIAQAIANQIGKFMIAQRISTLRSSGSR
jgi:hypothetical protein